MLRSHNQTMTWTNAIFEFRLVCSDNGSVAILYLAKFWTMYSSWDIDPKGFRAHSGTLLLRLRNFLQHVYLYTFCQALSVGLLRNKQCSKKKKKIALLPNGGFTAIKSLIAKAWWNVCERRPERRLLDTDMEGREKGRKKKTSTLLPHRIPSFNSNSKFYSNVLKVFLRSVYKYITSLAFASAAVVVADHAFRPTIFDLFVRNVKTALSEW